MLRGLLRDSEATKALLEKVGLFKSPELLEKYVIASEVTVEVLDLFLSRVFGTEREFIGNGSGNLKALWEGLGCVSFSDKKDAGEELPAQDRESNKEMEGLRVKVQDLERQLCAVQRQLQMQGEVSQLAVSLDSKLDEIARECAREVSGVKSQVTAVSKDVARLDKEVRDRASTGDVRGLFEEVARLKESEKGLVDRIEKMAEAERVLRDELQGEIKRLDAAVKVATDPLPLGFQFAYDSSQPLKGIIAHLTSECGGNVHEKGVVEVTASSCHSGGAKCVAELGTGSFFYSENEKDSWIRYDFKDRRVAPTSYSIRTDNGLSHPKSWVFEVSNDGREGSWEVVDRRENNGDLNGKYLTRNFKINPSPITCFRFVRLRQTGPNHRGDNIVFTLTLSSSLGRFPLHKCSTNRML